MPHKTLAFINADDGNKYRVRKWSDKHMTLSAEFGKPGRIDVRDPETFEWNHQSWWDASTEFGLQSDTAVLEEALHRLRTILDAEPEEILYDQFTDAFLDESGVTEASV